MIRADCTTRRITYHIWVAVALLISRAGAAELFPYPDNAALLYYQACFTCPEPSDYEMLIRVENGADPTEQVRQYLSQPACQDTIELMQAGTQITQCNWGLLYSRGLPLPLSTVHLLKRVASLLEVQARTLAADGQPRSSLEKCIGMRRFAAHLGDGTMIMSGLSHSVDGRAMSAIKYVLESTSVDAETLMWLKEQLTSVRGAPWRPERAVKSFREMESQRWVAHPDPLKEMKKALVERIEDEALKEKTRSLTESDLFVHAYGTSEDVIERVVPLLEGDMPYEEKYAEIEKVIGRVNEKANRGDPISLLSSFVADLDPYYRIHINATAMFRALMGAIEVYIVKARTGQLPQEFPGDLPKDPYSGQGFEYSPTKEGFVLRCRAKPVDRASIRQFEFRMRKG